MLGKTLFSALFAIAAAHPPSWKHRPWKGHDELTVGTSSGQVHGKVDPAYPNTRQFLGIPYAQSPTGDLRWAPPQPLSQPGARVQATELPPSCLQYLNTNSSSVYVDNVLQFNLQGLNRTGSVSEDCLTLSVWSPSKDACDRKAGGLPVLVFIYGGGFTTGGQDVPYQIPTQWVQRTQDHIVVSFNYRLNIFGYPNAPGLEDQNPGLLDQRAAVIWLKENIAAFGGDPDQMVLWGQSAGSISVDYYNFAYPSDPIVKGLVMDSGTAQTSIATTDTAQSNFTFVAENVGCEGYGDDDAGRLTCMRKVDGNKIEDFVARYQEMALSPAIAFTPVIDEKVVFSNYTERALGGYQAEIPAIIGTNAQDGVPFAPYNPNGPPVTESTEQLLMLFFCPATQSIRLRQQTGRPTHRYLYAGNWTNISPAPWLGAYHSSELPMLMGTHPDSRGPSTPAEYATSHAMQDAWVAFANDPCNGLESQDWPVYAQLGSNEVREFGAGTVAAQETSLAKLEAMCNGAKPAS